jgi:hypothetical protein
MELDTDLSNPKETAKVVDGLIQKDKISIAREIAEQWAKQYPDEILALQYAVMTQIFDGDAKTAEQTCLKALALEPSLPRNIANLAITLMTQGKLEQGLPLYESRYNNSMVAHHKVIFNGLDSTKQWQGQSLKGKAIFLAAEQGFGDQIQFIRFATDLRTLEPSQIILQTRPELVKLMRSMTDLDIVMTELPPSNDYDFWCPLLSVPLHLHLTSIPSPTKIPYLQPELERIFFWKEQLNQWFGNQPKVGIVWAGTPGNSVDGRRSLNTQDMLRIVEHKGNAAFVSLQIGSTGMELLNEQCARGVVPLLDLLNDFNETAAVIQNLNLVICVDTAVAHLAGALNKETWLMLPKGPDWRWGLDSSCTPWYPNMHLFRQPSAGDWQSVINKVIQKLHAQFA